MSLSVVRLSGPEAFADIASQWEALDALTFPRSPFSSPLWNSLWWKHYRKQAFLAHDEFLVLVIRSHDGELVAVAPLFRRVCPSIGPIRWRSIQFFGADASITEMRGIVCAPAHQEQVMNALGEYFQRDYRQWDLIRWDGLRNKSDEPPLSQCARGAADNIGQQPNFYIEIPGSWEELSKRVNGNFRRNMRKQRELFAQDGHSYKFRVITDASGMAEALERLFVLHGVRAKFNGMEVKHPDRFADVTNRSFVTEYVLAMGKRGHAYFFELEIAGKLVASQLAFAVGTDLWFYSSGFDPEWRKYGVMTMLTVEVLQWAIRERISRVNLSCGLDRGKVRWRPSEITVTHFLWRAPGTRARIFMQALQVLEASRLATAKLRGYRQGRDGVAEG